LIGVIGASYVHHHAAERRATDPWAAASWKCFD